MSLGGLSGKIKLLLKTPEITNSQLIEHHPPAPPHNPNTNYTFQQVPWKKLGTKFLNLAKCSLTPGFRAEIHRLKTSLLKVLSRMFEK